MKMIKSPLPKWSNRSTPSSRPIYHTSKAKNVAANVAVSRLCCRSILIIQSVAVSSLGIYKDLLDKGPGWDLIISEEVLHTILIELHLQVSSFNYTIVFRTSSSCSNRRCSKLWNGNWIYRQMYHILEKKCLTLF